MNPEYIGLLGTCIVLIAFLQHNERRIRIINSLGAIVFVIYGVMLNAPSVWVLNTILVLVHVRRLSQMDKHRNFNYRMSAKKSGGRR